MPARFACFLVAASFSSAAPAQGQACGEPFRETVIDVAGVVPRGVDVAYIVQQGAPVELVVGVDDVTFTSVPDCRPIRRPVAATVVVELAERASGPWRALGRSSTRSLRWTLPARTGVYWLRAAADADAHARRSAPRAVVVADGVVRFGRANAVRAVLTAESASIVLAADPTSNFTLPRADLFWRIERERGAARSARDGWAHVRADGSVSYVDAPAGLEWTLDAVARGGVRLTVEADGAPTRTVECGGGCRFAWLPAGEVRVRATSAFSDIRFTTRVGPGTTRERLCVASLLSGAAPAPTDCGAMAAWPEHASPVASCATGEPFDVGGRVVRVCPEEDDPMIARGARRTSLVVVGDRVVWAESDVDPSQRMMIRTVSTRGASVLELRLPERPRGPRPFEQCTVTAVVDDSGEPMAIGRCERDGRDSDGFLARRPGNGGTAWMVQRRRAPPEAAVVDSAGDAIIAEDRDLARCSRTRCRTLARLRAPVTHLVNDAGRVLAVTSDGMVQSVGPTGSSLVAPTPGFVGPVSRVVPSSRGLVALFGPVVRGSEYHPFCVASTVALLAHGATTWTALHSVAGEPGRILRCTYTDRVVVDVAVSPGRVWAVLRGFRPSSIRWEPLVAMP